MSRNIMKMVMEIKKQCVARESAVMAELGLSPSEYAGLSSMPRNGSLSGSGLAEALALSASRASRVAEALVQKGFLSRETSGDDRRIAELTLTPQGEETKRRIESFLEECEIRIRSNLAEPETRIVNDGLQALLAAMEA